jgi:hypothetical protein
MDSLKNQQEMDSRLILKILAAVIEQMPAPNRALAKTRLQQESEALMNGSNSAYDAHRLKELMAEIGL